VFHRALVIGIDSDPLASLRRRIDGIEPDRDFALNVASESVRRQTEALAGFLVGGPVVVIPAAFRVRALGLEGVGPPVDEEAEVVRHHASGRFETVLPHALLRKVGWLPLFHRGCGKTKKIFRQMARLSVDLAPYF